MSYLLILRSLFNCCPQLGALYDFQTNQTTDFMKYPAGVVVDCGYSFTHIVPFWDFTKLTYAIKRYFLLQFIRSFVAFCVCFCSYSVE
jgi:hypothetical protein